LCARADGSVEQAATFDADGELNAQISRGGSSTGTTWSRAQAWTMLAFAQAAHISPEFIVPAKKVADWYLTNAPEDLVVCYRDFRDPDIPNAPRDTSASAIAAAALVKLAPVAGPLYAAAAHDTLNTLETDH
jgi:unsaturated chondroitin disaccharide hydrolase